MANPLNHEKALYEYVRSQGSAIAIKQDVWDFIHHRVTDNIMAIILICQRLLADKKAMSAEEAARILAWIKDIKDAISVVTTPSKESPAFPQFQDVIPLNPVIKELVTHQFGNDIYAMEFMLHMAVDPVGPEPIPTEVIQKILNHALSIKEFITKLEDTAQWKDSEQKYHTLYDSFQDGLFLTNMKDDILEVNQAYLDMLGYSEEEIKKINSQKFTPEKWHKKQEEIISNLVMTRGYSDIFEKEYIKKDGNVIPVDLKVWLIRDSRGEPLGIWGIARNITERKMAEKEAIKDILDSQMVIQKISDGITVSDENGHFEIFNLKMEEITGYTAEEANRQADFSALIHPDPEDRQDVYKRLDEIVASKGRRETQTAIQAKDGSQKLLLVSTSLINYKNRNMFLSVWRDITERKRLESALQKSEMSFRRLFETAQDGILILDADSGRIREVNPFLIDMLGYSREVFLDKELWEVGAFVDIDKSKTAFQRLQNEGYVRYDDLPLQTKDGRLINVEFVSNTYDVGQEKVIQCNIRDITERRKSEERLKLMFEAVPNVLIMVDRTGKINMANAQAEKLFGFSQKELIGQTIEKLVPERFRVKDSDDRGGFYVDPTERPMGVGRYLCGLHKDGHEIQIEIGLSPVQTPEGPMVLTSITDITERKRLESALQKSEMSFRRLFETAQDGILILDADSGRIREVNPFLIDMLGYSREVFLGRELWEVGAFVDIDKSKTTFQRLQNEGYVRYDDLPLQTKDGRLINVEFVSNTYDVGQEKVIQCNIRDITERRHFELEREGSRKALKKSNRKLEELTLRDSQTGLYNHRHLKKVLEANFSRAERQGRPLSVIMMDIDYFKSINDVYGHVFGDLVLRQFAAQLTKAVRPYDVVIRIGGEEFIVLSLDSDRAGALALAKRIQNRIKLYSFRNKKHSVKIKLSLAIASYPEDNVAKDEALMDLADQILNKAKENGGNIIYSSLDLKNGIGKVPETSDVHLLKDKIGKLTKRANQSLVEATFAFAKTIELKDCYTGKHVERTVHYAVKISQALDLSKDRQEVIKGSAMLHDLGKVGISELILRKKSKLSAEEFERIKRHPQIGVDIIRPIHFLRPIIPALLHHHERWDGKGYPQGLKGRRIPLEARILAIADVYQALVSVRPYKKAYSKAKSIKIIKKASGTQFDPDIVKTFLKILQDEKSGSRS